MPNYDDYSVGVIRNYNSEGFGGDEYCYGPLDEVLQNVYDRFIELCEAFSQGDDVFSEASEKAEPTVEYFNSISTLEDNGLELYASIFSGSESLLSILENLICEKEKYFGFDIDKEYEEDDLDESDYEMWHFLRDALDSSDNLEKVVSAIEVLVDNYEPEY